jgi:hypothetical protein
MRAPDIEGEENMDEGDIGNWGLRPVHKAIVCDNCSDVSLM